MINLKISRRAAVAAVTGGILSACASASGIVLSFEDDFSGPEGSPPDPVKWRHDLGNTGYGYRQLQTYTRSRANSFLDGQGHLVIRATRDGDGYTSARLTTFGRFTQYRGTFEARIKLEVQPGLWPAFWLLGLGRWPSHGEVDIIENYGQDFGEASVHTPDGADSVFTAAKSIPVDDDWHVWRTVWDAHGFSFARDGIKYLTVNPSELRNWPFSTGSPMYLIVNLAIGGAAGVPPASTRFPAEMMVDYVRVWKLRGMGCAGRRTPPILVVDLIPSGPCRGSGRNRVAELATLVFLAGMRLAGGAAATWTRCAARVPALTSLRASGKRCHPPG